MLSYSNDLARHQSKIIEFLKSLNLRPISVTQCCAYKFYIFLFPYTLMYTSCHYVYHKEQVLNDIAIVLSLLNIHYNNADTPTKCTIAGERTPEAGPFAVVSLESHKKANTCIFSRKIFLQTIIRLHARSFASCVNTYLRACIRTHVNALTHRSDDQTDRCRGSSVIARTSYLRGASSDDADAKPIGV